MRKLYSQLYTTNESQEVSPFPAGDHKTQINRRAQRHINHKTETSSLMGYDDSPGSQHNTWRYHNLLCSKAGISELETVNRNEFKTRYYASPGYLQVLNNSE